MKSITKKIKKITVIFLGIIIVTLSIPFASALVDNKVII